MRTGCSHEHSGLKKSGGHRAELRGCEGCHPHIQRGRTPARVPLPRAHPNTSLSGLPLAQWQVDGLGDRYEDRTEPTTLSPVTCWATRLLPEAPTVRAVRGPAKRGFEPGPGTPTVGKMRFSGETGNWLYSEMTDKQEGRAPFP